MTAPAFDHFGNPATAFCSHCHGTGRATDPSTGQPVTDAEIGLVVSAIRRRHGIAATFVADAMGFSAQYVSDLENGRRAWSLELVTRYQEAVGTVLKTRKQDKAEVGRRRPTCPNGHGDEATVYGATRWSCGVCGETLTMEAQP